MKTNVKHLGSALLLLLIALLPALVRAEPAVPLFDKAKLIVEQLQDLDSMQRNVEACYFSEKRTSTVASRSAHLWPKHAGLDGKLLNRVFGHLAGTPEYEGFISAYRSLMQRPDYRRLHTDELFAEYMRLLESGRMRFLTQLKDCQEDSAEKFAVQAHEGLAEPIPVKTVRFGLANGSQRPGSGRAVAAAGLQVQMPLSDSAPLARGRKSASRVVVHGMDRSGSATTAVLTVGTRYSNQVGKKNGPRMVDTNVGVPAETNAVDRILKVPIAPTTVGGLPRRPSYQWGRQKTLKERLGPNAVTALSPKKGPTK